jgi:hypothetical protein
VSTFVDRGVSRGQRGGSPTVVNLSFLDWGCLIRMSIFTGAELSILPSRLPWLVTANVPSSLILLTLMMEAVRSSETSVLTNTT